MVALPDKPARINNHGQLIWAVADLLRGDYKQSEYGRVIRRRHLVAQARANPIENFRLVLNDRFIRSIVERMDDNADIFGKILDDPTFKAVVMDHYLRRVFEQANASTTVEPG